MKKLSIFIILILIIGAIFYFWQENTKNYIEDTPKFWNLSFQFSEQRKIDKQFINYAPLSLYDMTQLIAKEEAWQFVSKDYGDMGILITQIDDKINGQEQKYWQYFVNSEQAQISADKYIPPADSLIEWKFIKSEF